MNSRTIKDTHPELFEQLVDKSVIPTHGSRKKVAWRCPLNHEWFATPNNRASSGSGCSYCSNRVALQGFNDLSVTDPGLFSMLVDKDTPVLRGSTRKVEWECPAGHRYFATPNSKSSGGNGCPICSGRLVAKGVNDLSVTHPDLYEELLDRSVCYSRGARAKVTWVCPVGHRYIAKVSDRTCKGSGCPYCSGAIAKGINDLEETHPNLFKELVDKRIVLSALGKRRVEWRCGRGHVYKMSPVSRTAKSGGCPYCSGKFPILGETDFLSTHPLLTNEMSDPVIGTFHTARSSLKTEWKCFVGHVWEARIRDRARGGGCPKCILHGTSREEIAFADDIARAGYEIERNTRQVVPPFELDIYIPSHRCGIEFNGVYWHSTPDAKVRDEKKAILCKEAGVTLVVVTDKQYKINPEATIRDVIRRVERCQDGEDD